MKLGRTAAVAAALILGAMACTSTTEIANAPELRSKPNPDQPEELAAVADRISDVVEPDVEVDVVPAESFGQVEPAVQGERGDREQTSPAGPKEPNEPEDSAAEISDAGPDDQGTVVFTSNVDGDHDIYLLDMATLDVELLTDSDRWESVVTASPDGSKLAYVSVDPGPEQDPYLIGPAIVMAADGSERALVTETDEFVSAIQWSNSNDALLQVRRGRVWISDQGGESLRQLTPDNIIVRVSEDEVSNWWSPDDTQIIFVGSEVGAGSANSLYIIDAAGGSPRVLAESRDAAAAWSPDGTRISFGHDPAGDQDWDIYTIAPDGTGLSALVTSPSQDWTARWSPDGEWVAFRTSVKGVGFQLFVTRADGSDRRQLTNITEGYPLWFRWAPNSDRLIFAEDDWDYGWKHSPAQEMQLVDLDGNITPLGVDGRPVVWR